MTKIEKVTPFSLEDTVNSARPRLTLEGIFHKFAAETTAHGIPRIINRRKPLSKFFWLCLVVGAFTIFFVQTTILLSNYFTFNTKINLINSEGVFFPAVTVCNLNKMKRSLLEFSDEWKKVILDDDRVLETAPDCENYTPSLTTMMEGSVIKEEVTVQPRNESQSMIRKRRDTDDDRDDEEADDYNSFYYESSPQETNMDEIAHEHLGAEPFEDGIASSPPQIPSKEDLEKFGHQGKDFILQCTFNRRPCSYTDFFILQNKEYGNCFTFNGKGKTAYPRVTKIGSNYGLHLTLNIEQSEYVGSFADGTGVRLAIHSSDILPHPEDVGLSLSPGFATNIGIRQVEISRLPAPYGNCTKGPGHGYLQNATYSYSIISCQKKCLLDKMASNCSCVTDIYDDYKGISFCTRQDRNCRQSAEKAFYTNELGCDCPAQCHEYIYNMQTTSSVWPSQRYYWHLREKLSKQGKFSSDILEDVKTARENLVRVKIYFQELNYERVEQVPANTIESVLGNLGGLLGLYIGFSVITIWEMFVLIYDVFAFLLKNK